MEHKRVDLPLDASKKHNILERMRKELPECPDLLIGQQPSKTDNLYHRPQP
jgi:hypothetical protein